MTTEDMHARLRAAERDRDAALAELDRASKRRDELVWLIGEQAVELARLRRERDTCPVTPADDDDAPRLDTGGRLAVVAPVLRR